MTWLVGDVVSAVCVVCFWGFCSWVSHRKPSKEVALLDEFGGFWRIGRLGERGGLDVGRCGWFCFDLVRSWCFLCGIVASA